MQGCNQYCTFCIVPYTRGEERSRTIRRHRGRMPRIGRARRQRNHFARPDRDQLRQARHPSRSTASPRFVQLLEAVHEIEGLERIRFTSPHPKGYGDDLVEAYARLPKLCRKRAHPGAKRQRSPAQIDASRLHPRTFPRASSRSCARSQPEHRHHHRYHRRFPGRNRRGFRSKRLSLAREVEFDNAYIFKYSTAQRHARRRHAGPSCHRRSKKNATSGCCS